MATLLPSPVARSFTAFGPVHSGIRNPYPQIEVPGRCRGQNPRPGGRIRRTKTEGLDGPARRTIPLILQVLRNHCNYPDFLARGGRIDLLRAVRPLSDAIACNPQTLCSTGRERAPRDSRSGTLRRNETGRRRQSGDGKHFHVRRHWLAGGWECAKTTTFSTGIECCERLANLPLGTPARLYRCSSACPRSESMRRPTCQVPEYIVVHFLLVQL